jgi:SPP1 family predicted phage head-tail adaptor
MDSGINKILPTEFRRRITVKRPNSVTDDSGGTTNAGFTIRFTTWAKIEPMRTQEKVMFGMEAFSNAYKITTRFANSRQFTVADLIDYNDGVNFTYDVEGTTSFNGEQVFLKDRVLIQFGVTPIPGNESVISPTGVNTVNIPAFKGWNIQPDRLGGIGTMIEGVHYSWNKTTADFTLLTANDVLGNGEYIYFNFPVKPSNTSSGTPVPSPSPLPSSIRTLVVKSVQLVSEDYKNFLIIVASEFNVNG